MRYGKLQKFCKKKCKDQTPSSGNQRELRPREHLIVPNEYEEILLTQTFLKPTD